VRAACAEQGGHVLAFLPGTGEIRRTQEALAAWALEQGVRVVPLHGQLSPEEQDEALSLGGPRRVILATNVAETSLTLPGVRAVVDAGYARVLRHDPSCGLDRLELSKISQASADQRAGRAGREAPGLCVRLWSEHDHRARPAFEEPEVRRVDLAGPALQLMAWGESDLDAFPWVERPSSAALERARALLRALGALGPSGVTPLGQAMAAWPLHPRLARLMISAHELGVVRRASLAAALLAERDPWVRQERGGGPKRRADSDVVERVEALEAFERGGRSSELHAGAARNLLRARDQLARIAGQVLGRERASAAHPDEALGRALLAAFPDRLARRRQPGGARAVMVGGRGVSLDERSVVWDAELFLCVEMDAGDKADALVRVASGVERAWLDPREVVRERGAIFDAEKGRVVAVERERWRELVLSERIAGAPDPLDAARILAQVVAADPARYLPLAEGELAQVLARVRFLARWMPELGLPSFEGEGLREVIEAGCAGLRALDELRRVDWAEQVSRALTWPQRETLAREAPDKLEVPSGSFIRLDYQAEGPPILAARIQELFGLADTPKLAGGRVGVVMHLLAPNYRPQQVTQDLRSFWDKTYQEVRRELRQRYPKHSWPDDPWTAPPQRRPGRPRG
jgi:ATP-dependent helicase HrpB